ncbi:glycosyltransferase [Rhodococcus ruber]|uniref:glycosyltransferase family 4 protein n=1 Tax=Rhodococcus ruber TaxID=1830 RepID=UPI001AFA4B56|nr:glycosyltransferase [Rhodococcus ruber]
MGPRILLVSRSTVGHACAGGMELSLDGLARNLKSAGCSVAILTTSGIVDSSAISVFDSVFAVPVKSPGRYSLRWWSGSLRYAVRLRSAYDAVVSISSAGSAFLIVPNRPMVVAQCHGTAIAEVRSSINSLGLREVAKIGLNLGRAIREFVAYRRFDAVIAVSDEVSLQLRRFPYRVMESRVRMIPNGVSVSDLHFDAGLREAARRNWGVGEEDSVGLVLSRLHRQKGVDLAISALALGQSSNRVLIIAGDGPENASLRMLALRLGVLDRVRFVGRLARDEVVSALSGADVFVFPTRRVEGLPLSLLEALASGLPVITTRGCNVPSDLRTSVFEVDCMPARISSAWDDCATAGGVTYSGRPPRSSRLPPRYSESVMERDYVEFITAKIGEGIVSPSLNREMD